MYFAEVYPVLRHAPTGRIAVQEGMTGTRKTEDEEERKRIHPLPAGRLLPRPEGRWKGT